MLEIATESLGDAVEVRQLRLPDDPLPEADGIVAVGHPLNYLPDVNDFGQAVVAIGQALRPGGVVAFDVCDLKWARVRQGEANFARVEPDWTLITQYSMPTPDRFVRDITTFVANEDGSWRRDTERHENVLVDVSRVPALLAQHDIEASVRSSFGAESLPRGLYAVVGRRGAERPVPPRPV